MKAKKLMVNEEPKLTRDRVFEIIANGTIYGNLGLFIGAGLPMAIFNEHKQTIALSWGELIFKCAKAFGIPYKKIAKVGTSYPEIASQLCKLIAAKKNIPYSEALKKLKQKIADITCLYPEIKDRKKYREYFDILDPNWIITTNYDTVIESILTGKSQPLAPDDQMVSPRNHIPIYHLHGIRTNPNSIIITQEDYVSLFRPNQYRLQKLPLTIKESVTVLLGYNLGDFNVLTAVDWSRNVFKSESPSFPNDMVQLLHTSYKPKAEPYYDDNEILILEFNDLSEILEEICDSIEAQRKESALLLKRLKKVDKKYMNPSEDMVQGFVDSQKSREIILYLLKENKNYFINGFLELLSKANELSWKRAREKNAFYAYAENLELLLDILQNLEIKSTPPALIEMLTYSMNRVAPYIGQKLGDSHSAFRTWNKRKGDLSSEIVNEVRNISKSRQYYHLLELLEPTR